MERPSPVAVAANGEVCRRAALYPDRFSLFGVDRHARPIVSWMDYGEVVTTTLHRDVVHNCW